MFAKILKFNSTNVYYIIPLFDSELNKDDVLSLLVQYFDEMYNKYSVNSSWMNCFPYCVPSIVLDARDTNMNLTC